MYVQWLKGEFGSCSSHIANVAPNTGKPIAVPLRMLEVFAEMEVYMIASSAPRAIQVLQNILLHLINQGIHMETCKNMLNIWSLVR